MFFFSKHFGKREVPLKKDMERTSPYRSSLVEYGSLTNLVVEKEAQDKEVQKKSIWCVRRSLFLLMVGTSCLYSAVDANMNIVSSVASQGGLGSAALLVYGVVQVVNSLLANAYTPVWLSRKALFTSMFALTLYIVANVYISWFTFIIAAILQGFGYSLQWIAGNVYNTEIGHFYANLINDHPEPILVRIFGVFNAAVQSGFLFGNIAVYLILSGDDRERNRSLANESLESSTVCDVCGARFYENNAENVPQLQRPSESQLHMLTCVFTILSLIGCLLIAFMDDFGKKASESLSEKLKSFGRTVKALLWRVREVRMALLFPITLFIGMEQAYIMTEFTMAFVGCCLGISSIGLVMICFGLVDVVICLLQEFAIRLFGRKFVIGFGIITGISTLFVLLFWKPTPHEQGVYYLLASLWAVLDSILITQVFAFYSLLFEEEADAAFSVAILWVSLGFLVSFTYALLLVQQIKIIVMICVLVIGGFCYAILEFKLLYYN